MNDWLHESKVKKVNDTIDAFDQLIPIRENQQSLKDHHLKTIYSYDVRDSEMYRYLYKVEK